MPVASPAAPLDPIPVTSPSNPATTPRLSRLARTAKTSVVRDLLRAAAKPGMLSMAGGLPAPGVIPRERLAQASERVCRSAMGLSEWTAGAVDPWQYSPTEGIGPLTEVLASRESMQRHERLLVTTGSQQGLDLVAAAVLDRGDLLAVAEVSYLGALQAASSYQPQLWAVESDECGIRPDALEAGLTAGLRPAAVYVVSNFANPDGATMPLERRRALAELADRFGFWLIEDDPYGELSFDGSRLPSLRSLSDRTIVLGSSSKILAPGLRVGWAIGPDSVIGAMETVKQGRDLHTSSLAQAIVADVLADEPFMRDHLAAARGHYAARARAAAAAWATVPGMVLRPATGGMFHWVDLGVDADAALVAALERDVCFVPGSAFASPHAQRSGSTAQRSGSTAQRSGSTAQRSGSTAQRSGSDGASDAEAIGHHARFSFATLNDEQLAEGIARVASAVDHVRSTGCEAARIGR